MLPPAPMLGSDSVLGARGGAAPGAAAVAAGSGGGDCGGGGGDCGDCGGRGGSVDGDCGSVFGDDLDDGNGADDDDGFGGLLLPVECGGFADEICREADKAGDDNADDQRGLSVSVLAAAGRRCSCQSSRCAAIERGCKKRRK